MFKQFIISSTLFLSLIVSGYSQTTLNTGEIAIIAMNTDGNDEFSFVLLAPITNGTVIKFTESGWLSAGGFRGGGSGSEGTITWTSSSALVCGTEITITSNGSATSSGSTSISGSWALSASGDQILAYQGTSAAPTFIYAVNNDGAGVWQANATSTNNSAIPTGLTNGNNAVALVEADNQRYDCSTTTPSAAILAAVSNNSNWLSDNTTPYSIPLNCGFTCAACVVSAEPTTNASSLIFPDTTCNSIDLSWINGNGTNRIIVASTSPITGTPSDQTTYTANSIFGSGSIISAGEFVIFNGAGTSITVTNLNPTTTYYFAIFEYNGTIANCDENYATSSSLIANFATSICPISTSPQISGILVNACGGSEGLDEFVTFSTGNTALPIDSITATFPSGGAYCNSGCGTNTWVTNSTYVAQLNTTAACPGLFVEADPIPAGASVFLFTGATPTFNFDFTGMCGSGPVYVMFSSNTSVSGRFSNYNGDCSTRTLTMDFGTTSSDTATYSRCLTSNLDGDYVQFAPDGSATYQNDGNCTPTAILPITLLKFEGKVMGNGSNRLEWSTSSEINNEFFSIERSLDALNFEEVGEDNGAGNSNHLIQYNFIDNASISGINYYRLKQTDFDGDYSYSDIIALNNKQDNVKIFVANNILQVNFNGEVNTSVLQIIDAVGRIVYNNETNTNVKINASEFSKGIYIVKVSSTKGNTIQKVKF
tara:strand:+ start:191 stop:2320 length:2130 start_codon:yes stop_codon:yes gene_type:complete